MYAIMPTSLFAHAECSIVGAGTKGTEICRAGHFRYFLIFSTVKNDFIAFFIKLIGQGVGFLYRTGAEIGC